jgi:hypothetical protein
MNKSDLKTGMRVVLRNGSILTVVRESMEAFEGYFGRDKDLQQGFLVNPKENSHSWSLLSDYSEHLFSDAGSLGEDQEEYDIVEVLIPYHPYDIFYDYKNYKSIWKRESEEINTLKGSIDIVQEKIRELIQERESFQQQIDELEGEQ